MTTEGALSSVRIGSYVQLNGKLQSFSAATNPGEFDLQNYYFTKGYRFQLKNATIMGQSQTYSIWRDALWQLRKRFGEQLMYLMGPEDGAVLQAMLLGDKTQMQPEIKSLYQKSGIAHILAISGLHISILGTGLYQMLRKCRIKVLPAAIISAIIITGYCFLTGGGTSTIRAMVMFYFFLGAKLTRRTNDPVTSLSVAACIIVMTNPYFLLSSGFWLSFMAVLGIFVFVPVVSWKGKSSKNFWRRRLHEGMQKLCSGVGLSLFSLPMMLFFFYEYPVYSIVLNLLILPLMTVLIYGALLALLLSFWWPLLGMLLAVPCHWILEFYETLCLFVQKLACRHWTAGKPELWQMLLFYAICFGLAAYEVFQKEPKRKLPKEEPPKENPPEEEPPKERSPKVKSPKENPPKEKPPLDMPQANKKNPLQKYKAAIIKYVLLLGAVCIFALPKLERGQITILDVGQGDGICIQQEGGLTCMIDGGSSSKRQVGKYQLLPFMKHQGIGRIDYWFVSHPDKDHCNGLLELIELSEVEDLEIRHIVLPGAAGMETACEEIIVAAQQKGIPVLFMSAGDFLESGDLQLQCLFPEKSYYNSDVNACSMVLYMTFGECTMLFTGDATLESESRLLSQYPEKELLFLKVGHHGSNTSTSQQLLSAYHPRYAFISCGRKNSYGHPHEEVLELLREQQMEVLRTDHLGAIRIHLDLRGNITIKSFLQE